MLLKAAFHAAININPSIPEKADIVQNTIDLRRILGRQSPKVANSFGT